MQQMQNHLSQPNIPSRQKTASLAHAAAVRVALPSAKTRWDRVLRLWWRAFLWLGLPVHLDQAKQKSEHRLFKTTATLGTQLPLSYDHWKRTEQKVEVFQNFEGNAAASPPVVLENGCMHQGIITGLSLLQLQYSVWIAGSSWRVRLFSQTEHHTSNGFLDPGLASGSKRL